MITSFPLTINSSQLSVCYPFTVNGEWLTANRATGHSTLPIRQAQGSLSDSRRLRDEPSGLDSKRRSD